MKKVSLIPLFVLLFAGLLWAAGQQMAGRTSNWNEGSTATFYAGGANDSVYFENTDLRTYKGVVYGLYVSSLGDSVDSVVVTCETSAYDDTLFDQWTSCGGRTKFTTTGFSTVSAMSMTGAEHRAEPMAVQDSAANATYREVFPVHNYGRTKLRAWCNAGGSSATRTIVIRCNVKRVKY